ncbi:MAG: Acyl-CoA dehydrogenase [Bacteroidetes bacterium]|jgi:alkylation response protein AidB-like acyl-CoA dehydrogenase|nr:Acyl-CoA dehydrogenase [Bacteroidota bacterium]
MDFSLSNEQKLIREQIIAFAEKELNSKAAERDKDQLFPRELWLKAGEQKLTGLTVPSLFGGGNMDPFSAIIALEALGYSCTDGGLNFAICAHFLAGVSPLLHFGNNAQKEKYLSSVSTGKSIMVNCMTENTSGSDAFHLKTSAKRYKDGFIIDGSKTFASNGPVADTILIYTLTDENKGFLGGITAFILDMKTEGISIGNSLEKMGLRSCNMCELFFDNVFVSESDILGQIGGGTTVFNYSMEWERTGMAACQIGSMQRLLEQSIKYAQTRIISNESIGKKQAVSHRIANMKMQLEAGRLLTYKAANGLNTGRENTLNASIAKLFVSEAYTAAAMEAVTIHGGNGYTSSYPIERALRDAIGSTIYSGTSDIQRNIISSWLGL